EVVLAVGVLHVGDGFSPFVYQKHAAAQQVAGFAHALGINVCLWDHTAAQQHGDLVGVEPVVLGLAAVNGLHVQGVAQHEGNLLGGAEVGQPVPGEHAFAGNDQAVAEGSDGSAQRGGIRCQVVFEDNLTGRVKDADGEGPGVEIDAAVKSVLLVVE